MAEKVPFRLRAKEVSRVEAFSDIVFGFALTLIVVSLEVPETYEELMHEISGFAGFAICFSVLMWIWHAHHTFFRRYALTDEITIALNTALLFLVLFYVYPLKFVFEVVTGHLRQTGAGDASRLFLIYGLGFGGIFLVLELLYVHAWRQRERLALTPLERHDTRTSMMMYGGYILIGLASVGVALFVPLRYIGLAGWMYFLIGPVSAVIGGRRGAQRHRLQTTLESTASASTTPTPHQT